MRKYSYFPGCSMGGTGRPYDESLRALLALLDVEVKEVDDWNCCGATVYMSVDETKAFALSARNMALAEREEADLLVPCNACYVVTNKARHFLAEYPEVAAPVREALGAAGLEYRGKVRLRHPLEILFNDIGLEAIRSKVVKPLKGLKVVPYYGCFVTRPYAVFDSPNEPVIMDRLLEAAGAEVVKWPLKTRCCGGSETGTLPEVGLYLVNILFREAMRRGADMIATVCPLCQFNLEAYQGKISRKFGKVSLPVAYYSQLLGLAMGLTPAQVALTRNLVPGLRVLEKAGVAT